MTDSFTDEDDEDPVEFTYEMQKAELGLKGSNEENSLSRKGSHNLRLGQRQSSDKVLYMEEIHKRYKALRSVTHTFKYTCKKGEEITKVEAIDCKDDGTGGEPKLKKGGVGQNEVEIEVTSQWMRGLDFKFYVYGKKK